MPVRINLLGGPGVGKSRVAAYLFGNLHQYKVEHVQEYIKSWAYRGINKEGMDGFYIFSKQLHREEILLRQGISIITDSPLWLNFAYTEMEGKHFAPPMAQMCGLFDSLYPSYNFLLRRATKYQEHGRYETKEEAIAKDARLESILLSYDVEIYGQYDVKLRADLLRFVKDILMEDAKEGEDRAKDTNAIPA